MDENFEKAFERMDMSEIFNKNGNIIEKIADDILLEQEEETDIEEDLLIDGKINSGGPIDIIFFPKDQVSMAKRLLSFAVILAKRGERWPSNQVVARKIADFMDKAPAYIRVPSMYRKTFEDEMHIGTKTKYIFMPSKAISIASKLKSTDLLGRSLKIYLKYYGRSGNMFMILP